MGRQLRHSVWGGGSAKLARLGRWDDDVARTVEPDQLIGHVLHARALRAGHMADGGVLYMMVARS